MVTSSAADQPSHPSHKVLLRPKEGWQPVNFQEFWAYRELLYILAERDIKVRYKQTALGVLWAIIQPFFTMVVFTIISKIGNIPTDGLPPQLFYFCGMLPWLLFANALSSAGNSLVSNQNLITKVYFPRLVIPIASVLTGLVDFGISLGMMVLLMGWYRVAPGPQVIFLPVFIIMAFLAALGIGLWLSAMNVEFRDVRYIIPFLTQFWFYCTPVLYPASLVTSPWKKALLGINPMSGVIEGFRWCLVGGPRPGAMLAVSAVAIVLMLIGGLFYFRKMEKTFADRV